MCRLYRGDLKLPVDDDLQPMMRLVSLAIFGQDRSARVCGEDATDCLQQADIAWRNNQQITEAWRDHSADCQFSTFHAYEYTLAEDSSNLHRNVIFSSATVPQSIASAKEARLDVAHQVSARVIWRWQQVVALPNNKQQKNSIR